MAEDRTSGTEPRADVPDGRILPPRPALFVTHPVFRRPGFGKHHPLSTSRQAVLLDLCEAMGWLGPGQLREAPLADRATLERFHVPDYVDAFERAAATMSAPPEIRARYKLGTMENPIFHGMAERAKASVGGAILAAELALDGYLAFHPGGGTHHGRPGRASGFCYFNDPVFAIQRFLDAGLRRVLYVDLDAHHGDGVQDAFASNPRVAFVSIHEEGRWPGTGALADRLGGRAFNVPVPRNINDAEFARLDEAILLPLLRTGPDAVVVTLGADELRGDPLSAMQLANSTIWSAAERCVACAPHAVILGGGGYNPWTTARAWAGMWARISRQPIPDVLPEAAQQVLRGLTCDLVDEDDFDPAWLTTIVDSVRLGPVRHRIDEIITALQQPDFETP